MARDATGLKEAAICPALAPGHAMLPLPRYTKMRVGVVRSAFLSMAAALRPSDGCFPEEEKGFWCAESPPAAPHWVSLLGR